MPAPATVDELLDLIRKSAVVEETRATAYVQKLKSLGNLPKEPNKLAGFMVRDGLLTYFQAEQFLQGKWKRFTIGKYKVLEKLGSGGMGQVFLCEHKLMRRRVAVKVLPTAKAEDQSSLERFYREARAAAALDHQNIVRAYDIDQDDNLHFLVMEYVDGASFQEIIKKSGPMDVLRACHYIYWSAVGMQHAHEQGIIHRDIKPGNILVDRMGVVKILDMGLARFFHDDEDLITKKFDENVLGTADYLAPEQALDSHTVDGRADIYSLGATFYFLLTGGPPFVEGTVAQKLIWHQNREPKSLKAQRPEVPDGVVKIISKMMAKDPAARFQTPAELAATLGPWIQTPIAPPPENEMPMLCPAVIAAGTGMVTNTVSSKGLPGISTGNSTGGAAMRRTATSSVNLAPLPAPPPLSGSHLPAVAEGPPPLPNSPESNGPPADNHTSGENDWAAYADTNNPSRGNTDRKPGSSRKKQSPPAPGRKPKPAASEAPGQIPSGSKRIPWLWVGVGALVLAGAVGIVLMLSGGSSNSGTIQPKKIDGPRTIHVSRQSPVNVQELKVDTVARAFEIARPKDQIVIQDDEWTETLRLEGAKKDITLTPADGKHVVWKPTESKDPLAVLTIRNADGLTVRNIDFQAGSTAISGVRIEGRCPGLTLEDLEIVGGRDFGVKFVDCTGDTAHPVKLSRIRVRGGGITNIGVGVQGTVKNHSSFLKVESCRLEGPFKTAAFYFEGQVTDTEVTQTRVWQSQFGVVVKRNHADQQVKFNVNNNTFHTLSGPFLRFELGDPALDPNSASKYKFEFVGNFLFGVPNPLAASGDGKPLPPPQVLIATNNGRNAGPDGSFPTPVQVDQVQLPTDAKDDAKFLRSDALKSAGPGKVSVGANGP